MGGVCEYERHQFDVQSALDDRIVSNPLSGLKLDYWYQAIMAVCGAGFLISLTVETKGITNAAALILLAGGFFVGLGEWINHPIQTHIREPTIHSHGFTTTSHPRNPQPFGHVFDALGFVLLFLGSYKAVYGG